MRAAQYQHVHALVHHRLQVLAQGQFHQGIGSIAAFLDDGDQQRRRPLKQADAFAAALDGAFVGFGSDGGFGGDDADEGVGPIARGVHRGLGAGFDDAADGQVGELGPEGGQRQRGGRVAGDDHMFGVQRTKVLDDLSDEGGDGGGAFGAVGEAGGVAEINKVLVDQRLAQGLDNGEAAQSAVQNDDRGRNIHGDAIRGYTHISPLPREHCAD